MITINIDSKRNVSIAEVRKEQPKAEFVVRLDRNYFALMNEKEYRQFKREKETTFTALEEIELNKIYNNDSKALAADIKQIHDAFRNLRIYKYKVLKDGEEKKVDISIARARKILTRDMFVSAIVRAAFHWSSSRTAKDGSAVFFDCRKLFKD